MKYCAKCGKPIKSEFFHTAYGEDRCEDWSDVAPEHYTLRHLTNHFYYSYVWYNGCWHYYKGGLEIY